MPITSEVSSRDNLDSITTMEDQSRTGRYVAGGAALAGTLLALYHVLLRGTSSIAGICIPVIIMASYIIWVLYSARRDRRKALRIATAMQLTEVINEPARSTETVCKNVTINVAESDGNSTEKISHENPSFLKEDCTP
ncbi:uncharacterized protein LOC122523270 [Polistes fuscatus]|uniref:Uncharacterized protein LOC107065033 n=1 Tax=Polistes dominula TaxID=743375 RepID=A0ABM1I0R8_POLDO|nr:PREDICTED: uncharacterized protein LOC107065033 [Polistes dominula]XP_015173805.1 PREDICTED: uncharacterized protein LOC107065033 [Polistes dominula]XP_015173806.1 PREDICTED: uncharacterized protein LOC107065033 [Polistes dominula]XP_043500865.1 uncharacterized protein LOC122523270 [Polistes fuscatus]